MQFSQILKTARRGLSIILRVVIYGQWRMSARPRNASENCVELRIFGRPAPELAPKAEDSRRVYLAASIFHQFPIPDLRGHSTKTGARRLF